MYKRINKQKFCLAIFELFKPYQKNMLLNLNQSFEMKIKGFIKQNYGT